MTRTLDQAIEQFRRGLIDLINEAGLSPSIMLLLLDNVTKDIRLLQLTQGGGSDEEDAGGSAEGDTRGDEG